MHAQKALIEALHEPRAYPHKVDEVHVLQTHISWVLLTGDYAYKIKKAIKLDFLDFSTRAKRAHYCNEEYRLNRRFAPEIYDSVVPITGSVRAPVVGGDGKAIEFAVRMRQFDESTRADRCLHENRLSPEDFRSFAESLAQLHAESDPAQSQRYGSARAVCTGLTENAEQLRSLLGATERKAFDKVSDWLRETTTSLIRILDERAAGGAVRDCHGDLHLGNVVRYDGELMAFDCIEFDESLRTVDVIDDAAFLMMDLLAHERSDLGYEFLDAYLAASGQYSGLPVLRLYLVHRSLVRAKVAALRLKQTDGASIEDAERQVNVYLRLAHDLLAPQKPVVVLMHGLPASGKSWIARRLVAPLAAIRISSDIERKRLAGLSRESKSGSAPGKGLYTRSGNQKTYARLANLARMALRAGQNVIVDATFLREEQRTAFSSLAQQEKVRCVLVHCQVPAAVLEQRIAARQLERSDSEADQAVLRHAIKAMEPLHDSESLVIIDIDADADIDVDSLVRRIKDSRWLDEKAANSQTVTPKE